MQSVDLKPAIDNTGKAHRRSDDVLVIPVPPLKRETLSVSRKTLINRLNYLHFQSASVTILLLHRRNGRSLRLPAAPHACVDDNFTCSWAEALPPGVERGDFVVHQLEIPHGHHILQAEPIEPQLTENGLRCRLPDNCEQLTSRRVRRHPCTDITTEVIQNGAVFTGALEDFSASAFRLDLQAKPPQTFQWLKNDEPLTVIFSEQGKTLLSVQGQILRSHGERDRHTIVVAPSLAPQRRFPPKKFRSRRMQLQPAPEAVFTHPLTKALVRLDVIDLSGAGMAVAESPHEAQLLPGMRLDKLELRLADSFKLACEAQVVYCRRDDDTDGSAPWRCGLAILDMEVADHTRLMALLHRADDRNKCICPRIDLDQLWEFLFTSGFIYPQKYRSLQEYRAEFKATYSKLYDSTPEIARHFIYQENSRIVGHMAMLRQHSNAWLIHHHAADRNHSQSGGLETLQLVGEAVNEAQALYSSHMDYVMCYFRPENRFPQRIFGGVASHYDDPSLCSVDTFDYFHYRKEYAMNWRDGGRWRLTAAGEEDLLDLEAFYRNRSSGLALRCMDLAPQQQAGCALDESYRKAGFQRQQSVLALRKEGITVALFVLLRTEVGLNLSNLTDAITVFVLDNSEVPREALFTSLAVLAEEYPHDEVPVLTYPPDYAASQAIEAEKQYNLWVLNCQHLDPYFEFCSNIFNRVHRSGKEATP